MRVVIQLGVALIACGCAGDDRGGEPESWTCPPTWREVSGGGCAPAVLTCEGGGDCGEGTPFRRDADGRIRGEWLEPGEEGGPPSADFAPDIEPEHLEEGWAPDAGIDSCPAGWTPIDGGGCDPEVGSSCAAPSEPIPGGRCVDLSPCPGGDGFRDLPPEATGATIAYVRAGADPAVADGTRARPFATLSTAAAAIGGRGWLVVGPGEYPESLTVSEDLTIHGACTERVTLGAAGRDAPEISVRGDLEARHVRFRGVAASAGGHVLLEHVVLGGGGGTSVLADGPGTLVEIRDTVFREARPTPFYDGVGILAEDGAEVEVDRAFFALRHLSGATGLGGSRLTLRDVWLSGEATSPAEMPIGVGITGDSSVTLERAHISGAADLGLLVHGGSEMVVRDVVIDDVRSGPTTPGFGVLVQRGASLDATRMRIEEATRTAIVVTGDGSTATLERCEIRNTSPGCCPLGAYALDANTGGAITARASLFEGLVAFAMASSLEGSEIALVDSIVRGVRMGTDGLIGGGIAANDGGRIRAEGILVEDVDSRGVISSTDFPDVPSELVLEDSVVRDVRRTSEDAARGVDVLRSTASVRGTIVEGAGGVGVNVSGAGADVSVYDVLVRDVDPPAADLVGGCVFVADGAVLSAEGLRGEACRGMGVAVADGAMTTIRDSVISRSLPLEGVVGGAGLQVQAGTLSAQRVLLVENHGAGAASIGSTSVLTFDAGAILRTRAAGERQQGTGAVAAFGGTLEITRSVLRANSVLGVTVQSRGSVVMTDALVEDSRPTTEGFGGWGASVVDGGRLDAERVLFRSLREVGATVGSEREAPGRLRLGDVLVSDVAVGDRGFAVGVAAWDGGSLEAERLAVVRVAGAGVEAVSQQAVAVAGAPASVTLRDAFIGEVSSARIQIAEDSPDAMAAGRVVAYGLHAADRSTLEAERAVLQAGGFGLQSNGGRIVVRDGVVRQQVDAAGARSGESADEVTLDNVVFRDNAVDEVIVRDDLPSGSALPRPSEVCVGDC